MYIICINNPCFIIIATGSYDCINKTLIYWNMSKSMCTSDFTFHKILFRKHPVSIVEVKVAATSGQNVEDLLKNCLYHKFNLFVSFFLRSYKPLMNTTADSISAFSPHARVLYSVDNSTLSSLLNTIQWCTSTYLTDSVLEISQKQCSIPRYLISIPATP